MRRDAEQALTLMWLLSWIMHSLSLAYNTSPGHSAPGRPKLTKCRSPEKETFTCWWEPASTGGLPTSYHLYYRKESSVEVFECPDYHTVGNNSCYFDKQRTSIWIIYNITVVASNAMGKAYSESVEVDVMDIVQPHPPENVNVTLMQTRNIPYFLVKWHPPHDVDTRSGWVTIKYELRLKMGNSNDEEHSEWELNSAGKQLEFSIYSPQPGANYVVQVRCKLDQSHWSEWSASTFIHIPDNMSDTQNAFMIIGITITIIIFLLTAVGLTGNMKWLKHFLLPPVPKPKISGLNTQLLKSGKSEEIFSALISLAYPQIPHITDHPLEFLVVSDCDEETEFGGKACPEFQKAEICPADTTENIVQITCDSNQGLNTTGRSLPTTSLVLEELQRLHHLEFCGSPLKAKDCKCEHVSITAAGLTGYVKVDEEKEDLKSPGGEDYSVVSDVTNDNMFVLHPVWGQKEVTDVTKPLELRKLEVSSKLRDTVIQRFQADPDYFVT